MSFMFWVTCYAHGHCIWGETEACWVLSWHILRRKYISGLHDRTAAQIIQMTTSFSAQCSRWNRFLTAFHHIPHLFKTALRIHHDILVDAATRYARMRTAAWAAIMDTWLWPRIITDVASTSTDFECPFLNRCWRELNIMHSTAGLFFYYHWFSK